METADCVVIGAGVVGLAIAARLAASRDVIVVERAATFGTETSSRNSEVIHAGIYYQPGSLKAWLCRRGRDLLYAYAAERGIPHQRLGKLIVATRAEEKSELDRLQALAEANGVSDLAFLDQAAVRALEPEVDAHAGLWSPSTGIIDSHQLMLSLVGDIERAGGAIAYNAPVISGTAGEGGIRLRAGDTELLCRTVINAAGLRAPEVARSIQGLPAAAVPQQYLAIGHYYALIGKSPFRHLVYPVPEPGGLGIHATLDLGGAVRFGPDVRWIESIDYRFDDSRKAAFTAAIARYWPAVDETRLQPAHTGIRPKLAGPDGGFADFRIDGPTAHGVPGLINLFGIESPGLTAALAIAEAVVGNIPSP